MSRPTPFFFVLMLLMRLSSVGEVPGVPTPWEREVSRVREAANERDAGAMGLLAYLIAMKLAAPQPDMNAGELAMAAGTSNGPYGLFATGMMHRSGYGAFAKDGDLAKRLLSEAAPALAELCVKGDPWAMALYPQCLDRKTAAPAQYAEAVQWQTKAADTGHPMAQFLVSLHYEQGNSVTKDVAKAQAYIEKAAQQGMPDAELVLALNYNDGTNVKQDTEQAMAWALKAAQHGAPAAQTWLARRYDEGKIVPADPIQAARWAAAAARQESVSGMALMASFMAKGKGLPQDEEAAAKLWEKAAAKGNTAAACELGISYLRGRGVGVNLSKASTLLQQARADEEFAQLNAELLKDLAQELQAASDAAPAAQLSGSLVVKGLSIGMDFEQAVKVMRERLEGFDVQVLVGAHHGCRAAVIDQPVVIARLKSIIEESLSQDTPLVAAIDMQHRMIGDRLPIRPGYLMADAEGRVSMIHWPSRLTNTLFKASDLDAAEFAKLFADAYKVPDWKRAVDGWSYTAPEGVKVEIDNVKTLTMQRVASKAAVQRAFD